MAKITYASLKLKTNTDVNKFMWEDKEIEVAKYLSISDKYDLIMMTLQKAKEKEYYNPIKLDLYFNLYIIYLYTNITFTEKQKENEEKLYDTLQSSGLLDRVIENMEEEEYDDLFTKLQDYIEGILKYNTTAAALIREIVTDLPAQADAAMKIVENFDPDKFAAVKDFAKAANGGRDI